MTQKAYPFSSGNTISGRLIKLPPESLPGIPLFRDQPVVVHAFARVQHGKFRVPLDPIVRPKRRAHEANAIDNDGIVLEEIHPRELGGGIAPLSKA